MPSDKVHTISPFFAHFVTLMPDYISHTYQAEASAKAERSAVFINNHGNINQEQHNAPKIKQPMQGNVCNVDKFPYLADLGQDFVKTGQITINQDLFMNYLMNVEIDE